MSKELYGNEFTLSELPLYKQKEIFAKLQLDLGLIKTILIETRKAKLLSPPMKSKDYERLNACIDFTIQGNANLLSYFERLQEEGKHSSLDDSPKEKELN